MEKFLESIRALIASFCFGVLFTLLGMWFYSSHFLSVPEGGAIEIIHAEQQEVDSSISEIYVWGAVENEGVVEIADGQDVFEKITSFGVRDDADLEVLRELISRCGDCTSIYIPTKCSSQVQGESNIANCININTASKAELITLPNIGEKRSDLVIEGRPYHSLSDIKNVKGIGDKTYEQLKPLICL